MIDKDEVFEIANDELVDEQFELEVKECKKYIQQVEEAQEQVVQAKKNLEDNERWLSEYLNKKELTKKPNTSSSNIAITSGFVGF